MRLVTWNIQHARRMDTGQPDVDAFAADVAALGADVLALQEVDRGTRRLGGADLLAVAAEASGLTPIDGHVRRRPGGGTYGNALLVRGEPADCEGWGCRARGGRRGGGPSRGARCGAVSVT